MREDCIRFQTRTYDTGDVARFCVLDLAPEARGVVPRTVRRMSRGRVSGSIPRREVEPEPDVPSDDIVGVLAEAEQIVVAAEPDAIAQVERPGTAESAGSSGGERNPATTTVASSASATVDALVRSSPQG
jgi:hypothetical protein